MLRDQVRIADPCHADWDGMNGDTRKRFCGSCTKHVHDLSAMTDGDARALLASSPNLCVRYTADADGQIRHTARRLPRLFALGVALIGASPALASSAVADPTDPGLMERVVRRVREAVGYPSDALTRAPLTVRMGDVADPLPPPPPQVAMGAVAPPPTLVLPPRLPEPATGTPVIPEVEEALRAQRR